MAATGLLAGGYQTYFRSVGPRRSYTLDPVPRVHLASGKADTSCTPSTSPPLYQSKSDTYIRQPHRQAAVAYARRGHDSGAENRKRGGRRFEFSSDGEQVTAELWGTSVRIPQQNLWQLALPVAMVLGLAAIISPLIIGAAFLALSIGAAMSITAVAMSFMWIPIMMAFGGMFMFTMFPLMALGIFPLGLMLKNLALLAITVGAAGVGFSLMRSLVSGKSAAKARQQEQQQASRGRQGSQDGPVLRAEARSLDHEDDDHEQQGGVAGDPEVSRMEAELKDFDSLLAEREQQRRREEWRQSKIRQT